MRPTWFPLTFLASQTPSSMSRNELNDVEKMSLKKEDLKSHNFFRDPRFFGEHSYSAFQSIEHNIDWNQALCWYPVTYLVFDIIFSRSDAETFKNTMFWFHFDLGGGGHVYRYPCKLKKWSVFDQNFHFLVFRARGTHVGRYLFSKSHLKIAFLGVSPSELKKFWISTPNSKNSWR